MAANRSTRTEIHNRCTDLLRFALAKFADGHAVDFKSVQSSCLAENIRKDQNAFYRHCRTIVEHLRRVSPMLEVLGIPLPEIEYCDGRLRIAVRKFVTRTTDRRQEKENLAHALVDHVLDNGTHLVPRTGTVYFGFGTTVLAVAERLFLHTNELKGGFGISTANIEILLRYCLACPPRSATYFLLTGVGEINLDEGCVLPDHRDAEISTSIMSFEAINPDGVVFADTSAKRDALQEALKRTTKRLILVGDHSKFNIGPDRFEIRLQDIIGKRTKVYLFTDDEPPSTHTIPGRITLICPRPPGSPPRHPR